MEYLLFFLTFFKIGLTSFGGGYGMISIIRETVLLNGWLTEETFLNMIAVCESTPGPIAINMATFIGSSRYGIIGSILATLGVVLPSFIIILIIVSLISNLLKKKVVRNFLNGVKPCVVALILSTVIIMGMELILSFTNIGDSIYINYFGIFILILLGLINFMYKKLFKSNMSPVIIILISGILGIIFYV